MADVMPRRYVMYPSLYIIHGKGIKLRSGTHLEAIKFLIRQ